MEDTSAAAYLRPETAQGIFVNFKNIYQSARKRPPFGVAQIGKSFRNEITPGNFTFRVREFEQAELEYFVPDDGKDMEVFREWVDRAQGRGMRATASPPSACASTNSPTQERPHYAKAGIDVEYLFPWGWGELESIAHRGTYDLDAHMKLSGKDLRFFDEASKTHYTPLLIESSAGMDRTTLTLLIDAYERETQRRSQRQGDGAHRPALPSGDRARSGRPSFRWLATSPNWSSARGDRGGAAPASSGRSTTRATSASSTAGKTRSVRRSASRSTTKRSTTAR